MKKNASIRCSVQNCKYNFMKEDYCSLPEISVGTHEVNPTTTECADCRSFAYKNS